MAERLNLNDLTKRANLTPVKPRADSFVQPVRTRARQVSPLDFRPLIEGFSKKQETDNALEELQAAENAQVLSQDTEALDALDKEIRSAISGITDPEERDKITSRIWFNHIEEGGLPPASHPRTLKHTRVLSAQRLANQFSLDAQGVVSDMLSDTSLDSGDLPTTEDIEGKLNEIREGYASSPLVAGSLTAEQTFAASTDKVLNEALALSQNRIQEAKDFQAKEELRHGLAVGDESVGTPGLKDLSQLDFSDPVMVAETNAAYGRLNELHPGLKYELAASIATFTTALARGGSEADLNTLKSLLDNVEDLSINGVLLREDDASSQRHPKSPRKILNDAEDQIQALEQKLEDEGPQLIRASNQGLIIAQAKIAERFAEQGDALLADADLRQKMIDEVLTDPLITSLFEDVGGTPNDILRGMIIGDLNRGLLQDYAAADALESTAIRDNIEKMGEQSVSIARAALEANRGNLTASDAALMDRKLAVQSRVNSFLSSEAWVKGPGAVMTTGGDTLDRLNPELQANGALLQADILSGLKQAANAIVLQNPTMDDDQLSTLLLELGASPEATAAMAPWTASLKSIQDRTSAWDAKVFADLSPSQLKAHVEEGQALFRPNDSGFTKAANFMQSQELQRAEGFKLAPRGVIDEFNVELASLEGKMAVLGDGELTEQEVSARRTFLVQQLTRESESLSEKHAELAPNDFNAAVAADLRIARDKLMSDSIFAEFQEKVTPEDEEVSVSTRTRKDELDLVLNGIQPRYEQGLGEDLGVLSEIRDWYDEGTGFFESFEDGRTRINRSISTNVLHDIPIDDWGNVGATYHSQVVLPASEILEGKISLTGAQAFDTGFGGTGYFPYLFMNVLETNYKLVPKELGGYEGVNPVARREAFEKFRTEIIADWKTNSRAILEGRAESSRFTRTLAALDLSVDLSGIETSRDGSPLTRKYRYRYRGEIGLTAIREFDPKKINPYTTLSFSTQEEISSLGEAEVMNILKAMGEEDPTTEDVEAYLDAQDTLLRAYLKR